MKTLDGYELKEGDKCWVSVQDPEGLHNISANPRKAVYMDEAAKNSGWDFSVGNRANVPVEVIAVWKNNPHTKVVK